MNDIDKLFKDILFSLQCIDTNGTSRDSAVKGINLIKQHMQSQDEQIELYKGAYASAHEVNIIQGNKLDKIKEELRNIHMDTISRQTLLDILKEEKNE